MMVAMIPAMVSAAPAISAHGNHYTTARDEQRHEGQHKE